jgi:septin family protein
MADWIREILTNHKDKVQFLLDFIEGDNQELDNSIPLMIVGSGGTGKTAVLNEVCLRTTSNLILIREGRFDFCHAADGPSGRCAYLIESNGTDEDYQFARYVNSHIVRFEKDASYV